jgi:hypothetical protein
MNNSYFSTIDISQLAELRDQHTGQDQRAPQQLQSRQALIQKEPAEEGSENRFCAQQDGGIRRRRNPLPDSL